MPCGPLPVTFRGLLNRRRFLAANDSVSRSNYYPIFRHSLLPGGDSDGLTARSTNRKTLGQDRMEFYGIARIAAIRKPDQTAKLCDNEAIKQHSLQAVSFGTNHRLARQSTI